MKIVKVSYTTKAGFSGENQRNIQAVMADLQSAGHAGINYNTCLCADGKTFIHTAFFSSEEEQQFLNSLLSFKYFQEQLKASGPEVAPKLEPLTLVGTSKAIF